MKRTCETCKHFCESFVEGQYRCFRTTPAVSSKLDSPACEHYELSKSDFVMAFDGCLIKAREKHPGFVPVPTGDKKAATYRALAQDERRVQRCFGATLAEVLREDIYEFLAEVAAGDFDRALEEAGDVMAVMFRALTGDGKKEESK